ncbi:unnamed protein product, partial [Prorocentrum cordatum]
TVQKRPVSRVWPNPVSPWLRAPAQLLHVTTEGPATSPPRESARERPHRAGAAAMRRARRGAAPRVALLALLPPTVAPADAGHRAGARGGNAQRGLGDLAARPVRCLGADPQELLRNLTSARAYNRLDHPGAAGGAPARVEQQIYVKKLVGVDQTGQTLTLSGFWRSAWLDERLAFAKEWGDCFDHLDLQLKRNLDGPPVQDPLLIWSPSLFFDNVLTESYGTYSFQVMPSGQVTRSIKILHKFSCAMDFGRMPFDSQRCPIRIMSYAEPDSSVNLGPIGNTFVDRHGDADGPVQNTLWTVADSFAAIAKEGYNFGSDAREYDVLTISFILQRRSAFYLRRDVAYAVLFVCMSYVGFFIDAESAPARAALATIPVLTMLSHLNSVEQTLPPLSERTWLHAILMLSLVYTGLAVVELAVVSATLSLERRRARRRATFEKLAKRMHDDDNPLNEREHKMFLTFFKTFDSAGIPDGTVSIKELRAGLRYFNVYYSLEQCEEVIALVRKKHVPAPSPRHKSLSGGERQDFDAPADAEAGRGPDSIAIALGGSPQSHNATPAVARGASVSAAAAAAQVVQEKPSYRTLPSPDLQRRVFFAALRSGRRNCLTPGFIGWFRLGLSQVDPLERCGRKTGNGGPMYDFSRCC